MLIVDRLEGEMVVVEYGTITFSLPRSLLPPTVAEGDVLNLQIAIDEQATAERRRQIRQYFDDLWSQE